MSDVTFTEYMEGVIDALGCFPGLDEIPGFTDVEGDTDLTIAEFNHAVDRLRLTAIRYFATGDLGVYPIKGRRLDGEIGRVRSLLLKFGRKGVLWTTEWSSAESFVRSASIEDLMSNTFKHYMMAIDVLMIAQRFSGKFKSISVDGFYQGKVLLQFTTSSGFPCRVWYAYGGTGWYDSMPSHIDQIQKYLDKKIVFRINTEFRCQRWILPRKPTPEKWFQTLIESGFGDRIPPCRTFPLSFAEELDELRLVILWYLVTGELKLDTPEHLVKNRLRFWNDLRKHTLVAVNSSDGTLSNKIDRSMGKAFGEYQLAVDMYLVLARYRNGRYVRGIKIGDKTDHSIYVFYSDTGLGNTVKYPQISTIYGLKDICARVKESNFRLFLESRIQSVVEDQSLIDGERIKLC